MSTTRRTFIAGMGATGIALASRDLFLDLLAQSPQGNVLKSKFKGLADIVLGEAKTQGASYADVRFTMNMGLPGASASFNAGGGAGGPDFGGGGGRGGGGRGGGGRGGRGGGGGRGGAIPSDAERQAGGFGVRVIHSGVWGFASSPIVTEDEIRRITRLAVEIARSSA